MNDPCSKGAVPKIPRVLNRGSYRNPIPKGAVLVARPSRWGNPYSLKDGYSREEAIMLHRLDILRRLEDDPNLLKPLRGKDLVCYCAPLPCHADTLLELANR